MKIGGYVASIQQKSQQLRGQIEKQKATTIDDVRVAVCPECGYTEMYLEDLSKLKD